MEQIEMNTIVRAHISEELIIEGIIVGKSSNSITESYIIKCIDNQLPNRVYNYDTFICQSINIEIMKVDGIIEYRR